MISLYDKANGNKKYAGWLTCALVAYGTFTTSLYSLPTVANELDGRVSETDFTGGNQPQTTSSSSNQLPSWFGASDLPNQQTTTFINSNQLPNWFGVADTPPQQQTSPMPRSPQLNVAIPASDAVQQGMLTELSKPPITANIEGGQDEYHVNWSAWRHRITDAVWDYVAAHSFIFWGMTRVGYNVTRDGHIQITSVFTPDPTGRSAKKLVKAVKCLEGTPTLEFPAGSKQTVHHNWNMSIGLPLPIVSSNIHKLYLHGGTEHVTERW